MKVVRNGNVLSVAQLTFSNGWTVSMAVEHRPDADVMIWNHKGETVQFRKWNRPHTDGELYNVSDDRLAELLIYVQKLDKHTSLTEVGSAFTAS